MKTIKAIILITALYLIPNLGAAEVFEPIAPKDTVVIELENGSRIIIYTKNTMQIV